MVKKMRSWTWHLLQIPVVDLLHTPNNDLLVIMVPMCLTHREDVDGAGEVVEVAAMAVAAMAHLEYTARPASKAVTAAVVCMYHHT
jgi:hypothetical protein